MKSLAKPGKLNTAVHDSPETGEVTGSLIKGVSGFCKRGLEMHPGFRIVIDDGRTSQPGR